MTAKRSLNAPTIMGDLQKEWNVTLSPDNPGRALKIVRPDTDPNLEHIGLVGDTYTIVLTGNDTNGQYCIIDMFIPAGGGPSPHRHDFEETFVVLEGEILATFRGREQIVRSGETIHIPSNAPHQFQNKSNKPARLLCICSPAGQEDFFVKLGAKVANRKAPSPKLNENERRDQLSKARQLALQYRTELLEKA